MISVFDILYFRKPFEGLVHAKRYKIKIHKIFREIAQFYISMDIRWHITVYHTCWIWWEVMKSIYRKNSVLFSPLLGNINNLILSIHCTVGWKSTYSTITPRHHPPAQSGLTIPKYLHYNEALNLLCPVSVPFCKICHLTFFIINAPLHYTDHV